MVDFHLNLTVYDFQEFLKGTRNPHTNAAEEGSLPMSFADLRPALLGGARISGGHTLRVAIADVDVGDAANWRLIF